MKYQVIIFTFKKKKKDFKKYSQKKTSITLAHTHSHIYTHSYTHIHTLIPQKYFSNMRICSYKSVSQNMRLN